MPRTAISLQSDGNPGRYERLGAKRKLNLIASIAADMSKCGLKPLSSAVLLSLACRGLIPEKLLETPAGWLLERLSQDFFEVETLQVDKSELARCLVSSAGDGEFVLFDAVLLDKGNVRESKRSHEKFQTFSGSFSKLLMDNTIRDPLFCGWLYQTILMDRKEDYSHSRNQKSTDELSRITQWFTPTWICDFLLAESFRGWEHTSSNDGTIDVNACAEVQNELRYVDEDFSRKLKTVTFLDSACGAGHILAPALLKLLSRRLTAAQKSENGGSSNARSALYFQNKEDVFASSEEITAIKNFDEQLVAQNMVNVLESELYGLDADPLMVQLSGLALYLTCRDLNRTAPLPIPLLYSFIDKLGGSNACHGSLLLSLDPRPNDVALRRIDGTTTPLEHLPNSFDVQTLNPPYLSHRLMPKESGRFLREHYDGSQYDLYTAFLELSIRLMSPQGRLALICQQSFLSTSRFEHLRKQLIERCKINSIVQLGAGAFASRGGEKVSNAIISLSKRNFNQEAHELSVYKLVSASAKKNAEQKGIPEYVKQTFSELELLTATRMIPGFPLVPFCPREVANLFQTHPTIAQSDNGIVLTNGLFTCDNKRFVRHFSELAEHDRSSWVPYDKGGGQKWFSTTPYLLEWKNDGDDIREFRLQRGQSKALPGERFYFQPGITYSYIGTKGFKARLLSPGSVFDIASSAMFSEQIDPLYLLGFLNSSLVRFILGTLNPTVNFQIGDLRRIPFCTPTNTIENEVAQFAKDAVELAREAETFSRSSPAYNRSLTSAEIAHRVVSINQAELRLQEAIDEVIFDLYKISNTTRDIIRENEWVTRTQSDLVSVSARNRIKMS